MFSGLTPDRHYVIPGSNMIVRINLEFDMFSSLNNNYDLSLTGFLQVLSPSHSHLSIAFSFPC